MTVLASILRVTVMAAAVATAAEVVAVVAAAALRVRMGPALVAQCVKGLLPR